MLFGLGDGGGGGAETNWAGLGGAGVGITRLGGLWDMRDGPVIKAGDARSGIGTLSDGC